jgi:hypothetical protein
LVPSWTPLVVDCQSKVPWVRLAKFSLLSSSEMRLLLVPYVTVMQISLVPAVVL